AGIAMREVHRQDEILVVEILVGVAEEVLLKLVLGALKRRRGRGDLPEFQRGYARRGDAQEGVLPDDRIVAFEDVLLVRIEDITDHIRIVVDERMSLVITVPGGEAEAPPILDRHKVSRLLPFARHNPGGSGEAERWIHG